MVVVCSRSCLERRRWGAKSELGSNHTSSRVWSSHESSKNAFLFRHVETLGHCPIHIDFEIEKMLSILYEKELSSSGCKITQFFNINTTNTGSADHIQVAFMNSNLGIFLILYLHDCTALPSLLPHWLLYESFPPTRSSISLKQMTRGSALSDYRRMDRPQDHQTCSWGRTKRRTLINSFLVLHFR